VVIIGLVALSTILVLYAADEPNRIDQAEELQQEAAITRATANYIQYCLSCHGPAGEGFLEGTGRVGMPLGGNTYATALNQQGLDEDGNPVSGGVEGRYDVLYQTIYDGRGAIMPAWGEDNGGQLNDEQIHELVVMIQNVDWNRVYNEAIHVAGGYPTVEPTVDPEAEAAGSGAGEATSAQESQPADGGSGELQVSAVDIAFEQTEISGPADTEFTITVTNNGASPHDFVIDELGIQTKLLNPGESETVTVNAPAGEYTYYCSVPGHRQAGMEGTLTVSADAGQAAPEGDEAATTGNGEGASGDEAAGGATELAVSAVDIAFEQKELSAPADTDVTITITNNGASPHDFVIEELGIQTKMLNPGESETVTVNAPAGTYTYFCSVPGHRQAGMEGTLTVG
jgi:nitrite reductase (NO-forming)